MAVPVFAAPAGSDTAREPEGAIAEAPVADDPERYFDGGVVPVDLGEVEREERERAEWLASSEAMRQRAASRDAYADLTPGESEELLRTLFAEQLQALNADPARFLSDAQITRQLDEGAAAVKDGNERFLLDASIPLRAQGEDGELAKVDLDLTETARGFETRNGLTQLVLPSRGDERTRLGEEGFAISQAQAAESSARRFGDKSVFYPDVLPDTDLFIARTAT